MRYFTKSTLVNAPLRSKLKTAPSHASHVVMNQSSNDDQPPGPYLRIGMDEC